MKSSPKNKRISSSPKRSSKPAGRKVKRREAHAGLDKAADDVPQADRMTFARDAEREAVLRELKELRQGLKIKVSERTFQLQEAQERSSAFVELQERERRHLACELHDEIGQILTDLKMMLAELLREASPTQQPALTEAHKTATLVLEQIRSLSLRLRPQVLDDLGLVLAIKWLVDQFRKRLSKARVLLDIPAKLNHPPASNAAITLYRVAQEALTNIAKHAHATMVRVEIRTRDGNLQLTIVDNGKGFDLDTVCKGYSTGLSGMAERVNLLGGEFHVHSSPGHGTAIRCSIPKDLSKK